MYAGQEVERSVPGASQRPQPLRSFSSSSGADNSRPSSPIASSSASTRSTRSAGTSVRASSFSSSSDATASVVSDSAASSSLSLVSSSSSHRSSGSSSQSASGSPLAALRSVKVQPDRHTAGMAAVAALKKIDAVRIDGCVERDGKLYYVVDVFLQRPESRIPTTVRDSQQSHQSQQQSRQSHQSHQSRQSLQEQWQEQWQERQRTRTTATTAAATAKDFGGRDPDFRLERTFSHFTKLRSKAYRDAQNAHGMVRCDLCDNVVTATLLSANQPKRFMNLVCSRETLARVLTEFLNDLVEITVRSRRSSGSLACDGQEQIPQLVLAFFQPEVDAGCHL